MEAKNNNVFTIDSLTTSTLSKKMYVIYGRGHHLVNHPGNVYYRSLVHSLAEYYAAFPTDKKKLVSELLYQSMKSQKPPFIFLAEFKVGHYAELDRDTAVRKISQCFREKQRKIKAVASTSELKTMTSEEIHLKMAEMQASQCFTIYTATFLHEDSYN